MFSQTLTNFKYSISNRSCSDGQIIIKLGTGFNPYIEQCRDGKAIIADVFQDHRELDKMK
jgi:hypothetical protein